MIQQQFKSNSKRVDSGVHQAGFLVLRATSMPSVLVELGFISTPAEEKYLASEEGSSSMANSIFNAFLAYKTEQQAREASVNNTPASKVIADDEEVKPIANVKPTPKASAEKTESTKNIQQKSTASKSEYSKATSTKQPATTKVGGNKTDAPVFKIQFLTASAKLSSNDKRLKGLQPVDYYVENGTYKYTYGASTDYNAVRSKLKSVTTKFKDAFIIAFKNDKKVNVNEAIKEFMRNKK